MGERTILHVDLDAFFAAVEQRDRPDLRGRPVVVGGRPDARGVVSAASYEARRHGIHSAMPLRVAARRCPDAVFLPVDAPRYRAASIRVIAILRRFTPDVEPVSIDEAFLDVTASRALFGGGAEIGAAIRAAVRAEEGLTASVGVATSKLVAKVASDLRKPDALVVVAPGTEAAFLAPLPIRRLWGVGERTAALLGELDVGTIGELAALPPGILERRLGRHGASLAERARGIDPDPVAAAGPPKTIGHEHTFESDTADPDELERTLLGLAEGVAARLRDGGVAARTVVLKVRDADFRTITRQVRVEPPADLVEPIYAAAAGLLRGELRGQRIRLLGITATGLGEPPGPRLFDDEDPRRRAAADALDRIRHRYGDGAVTRARLVRERPPAPFERDPTAPAREPDPALGPAGERRRRPRG